MNASTQSSKARIDRLAAGANLSAREREILNALIEGGATKEVANRLGISPSTVKFHQRKVLKKLKVDSRRELLERIL